MKEPGGDGNVLYRENINVVMMTLLQEVTIRGNWANLPILFLTTACETTITSK